MLLGVQYFVLISNDCEEADWQALSAAVCPYQLAGEVHLEDMYGLRGSACPPPPSHPLHCPLPCMHLLPFAHAPEHRPLGARRAGASLSVDTTHGVCVGGGCTCGGARRYTGVLCRGLASLHMHVVCSVRRYRCATEFQLGAYRIAYRAMSIAHTSKW